MRKDKKEIYSSGLFALIKNKSRDTALNSVSAGLFVCCLAILRPGQLNLNVTSYNADLNVTDKARLVSKYFLLELESA